MTLVTIATAALIASAAWGADRCPPGYVLGGLRCEVRERGNTPPPPPPKPERRECRIVVGSAPAAVGQSRTVVVAGGSVGDLVQKLEVAHKRRDGGRLDFRFAVLVTFSDEGSAEEREARAWSLSDDDIVGGTKSRRDKFFEVMGPKLAPKVAWDAAEEWLARESGVVDVVSCP